MAGKHYHFFSPILLFPKSPHPGAHKVRRRCPRDPLGSPLVFQILPSSSLLTQNNCFYLSCSKTSPEHKWIGNFPNQGVTMLSYKCNWNAKAPQGKGCVWSAPHWEQGDPGPGAWLAWGRKGVDRGWTPPPLGHVLPFHAPHPGLGIWVTLPAGHLTTPSSVSPAGYPVPTTSSSSFLLPIQPTLPDTPLPMSPLEPTLTTHPLHLRGWSLALCSFPFPPIPPPGTG